MKVKLTNWLLSTLELYRTDRICCHVRWNAPNYQPIVTQSVRRVYVETRPSERKIIITWIFTNLLYTPLKDTTIVSLNHFDGQTNLMSVNITIQSDLKWGEISLVEVITLIGAE
jgi:hypothetical protein